MAKEKATPVQLSAEEVAERDDIKRRSAAGETLLEEEIARVASRDVLRAVQASRSERMLYRAATEDGEALRIVFPPDASALKRLDSSRVALSDKKAGQNATIDMMDPKRTPPEEMDKQGRYLARIDKNIGRIDKLIHATGNSAETFLAAMQAGHVTARLGTVTELDQVTHVVEILPSSLERFKALGFLPPEVKFDDLPTVPPSLDGIALPLPKELNFIEMPNYYYDLDVPGIGMALRQNGRNYMQDRMSATPIQTMDVGRAKALLARTAGALVEKTKDLRSGSTFLGVIAPGDGTVATAHMGDSLAMYVIFNPENGEIKSGRLTKDQKPSMALKGIRGEGPWEENGKIYLGKDNWLTMTRALGDVRFGNHLKREPKIEGFDFSRALEKGKKVFILMGSDGIVVDGQTIPKENWITPQEQVNVIAGALRENPHITPTELARKVVTRALSSPSNNDNITAAVFEVKFKQGKAVSIFDGHGRSSETAEVAVDEFQHIMHNVRTGGLQAAFQHHDTIPPALGLPPEAESGISWVQYTGAKPAHREESYTGRE